MPRAASRTVASAIGLVAVLGISVVAPTGCGGSSSSSSTMPLYNETGASGSVGAGSAAGDARMIQRKRDSGTIELSGDRGAAMTAANREMEVHCGTHNYTITQEGEEVVGGEDGEPPQLAWRVHYACGPGAAPP